jgi:hypothetical protein
MSKPLTIDELKTQKRWVMWRSETVGGKQTKVPYQIDGRKAQSNNPATWRTYAECIAAVSRFSGVGVTLGNGVFGVDIDKCCDAVTGKFTPESREIVIGLDSYGEFSPSGTGCHVFCLGDMPEEYRACNTGKKGDSIVRTIPGCKQIELKGAGFYFTLTERHLHKTPLDLMPRQEQINALCKQVASIAQSKPHLVISGNEEERFSKLWAGDMSDYDDNHSRADLALCCILARRFNNDVWKIHDEFCKSKLYREKWERSDYRSATILKAVKGEPIFDTEEEVPIEDDGPDEYLVEALPEPMSEGWFPKGEVSLIGGSSGAGKTSWAMPLLEKIRKGESVFGHATKPRDYRILLHDRSKKGTRRTVRALGLPPEAIQRLIRLKATQQSRPPAEILEAAIEQQPGVEAWFIEGLDMWIPEMHKMESVSPILDGLQRVATQHNIAILATVGSPKQRGKDNKYSGRDTLFGSSALARKAETVVLMQLHDEDDSNSVRVCTVLPRNGRAEKLYFEWQSKGLCLTTKPEELPENTALYRMGLNVLAKYKPGEQVVYSAELGPETTFYRWRKQAVQEGKLVQSGGAYFVAQRVEPRPN